VRFEEITTFCFIASYVLALLLDASQFLRRSRVTRWVTIAFAVAGLVAHTIYLFVRSQQRDLPPLLNSTHDWLLVLAWLAIVMYLSVQLWDMQLSVGIFALPLVITLSVASRFVSTAASMSKSQRYEWGLFHASLWVFGFLGMALALIVSLMYLLQHSRLKHKKAELPALHLLSLERLSKLNWWLIIVSLPLLTLGMGTGLWLSYLKVSVDQKAELLNVAFMANAAIWTGMTILFGWLLVAKHPTGRMMAWRTVATCSFLILALLVVKLLRVDGIHGDTLLTPEPSLHKPARIQMVDSRRSVPLQLRGMS